eukprot:28787-Prymnesium_polylepis.1
MSCPAPARPWHLTSASVVFCCIQNVSMPENTSSPMLRAFRSTSWLLDCVPVSAASAERQPSRDKMRTECSHTRHSRHGPRPRFRTAEPSRSQS